MKIKKLKFVRNTAPENQRVLNFMRNPDWRIFLLLSYLDESDGNEQNKRIATVKIATNETNETYTYQLYYYQDHWWGLYMNLLES